MTNSAYLDQKPTDLDLESLQRQGISGFSRTRVKYKKKKKKKYVIYTKTGVSFVYFLLF